RLGQEGPKRVPILERDERIEHRGELDRRLLGETAAAAREHLLSDPPRPVRLAKSVRGDRLKGFREANRRFVGRRVGGDLARAVELTAVGEEGSPEAEDAEGVWAA